MSFVRASFFLFKTTTHYGHNIVKHPIIDRSLYIVNTQYLLFIFISILATRSHR